VDDAQYQRVLSFDPVQDHVAADGEAAEARAQVIAMPAGVRILAEQPEPIGYRIDQPLRDFDTAGLAEDLVGDVVEIGFRLRREAVGH
jgi:hypothetical protein